jgi:hypothetical protein
MTNAEVRALKPGQQVEARYESGWRSVVIVEVREQPWDGYRPLVVLARRGGLTSKGHLYPTWYFGPDSVRPPQHLDPVPANIYADFLDEHGEHRAAAMLREAFPLADGKVE